MTDQPKDEQFSTPQDDLNARIGVLTRREVEARILGPVVEALSERFDRETVQQVLRDTIIGLARSQGAKMAQLMGGDSTGHFRDSLQYWTRDDALYIDVLEHDAERLSFNVTRCRYAELYQALGLAGLGVTLSCNRDFALIDGFNPQATLERTQTIMEGAPYCDFRYTFSKPDDVEAEPPRYS